PDHSAERSLDRVVGLVVFGHSVKSFSDSSGLKAHCMRICCHLQRMIRNRLLQVPNNVLEPNSDDSLIYTPWSGCHWFHYRTACCQPSTCSRSLSRVRPRVTSIGSDHPPPRRLDSIQTRASKSRPYRSPGPPAFRFSSGSCTLWPVNVSSPFAPSTRKRYPRATSSGA